MWSTATPTRRGLPARLVSVPLSLSLSLCAILALIVAAPAAGQTCERTITAHVVALDQVYSWNRLGAVQPHGMIYALEHDVVPSNHDEDAVCESGGVGALSAGSVRLRRDKRPRPLVLRVNVGDCLDIHFTNLLDDPREKRNQPITREASVHVVGMQYRQQIEDGGMRIGTRDGLVTPGNSTIYHLYAQEEGTFLMYSGGAMVGGEGDNGTISAGLFGAVNVQPRGSRYFRSQVTQEDFERVATWSGEFPTIDYTARYPTSSSDPDECWRLDTPILEMIDNNEIVHSDLTAIITGPSLGGWSSNDYPYPLDDPIYPKRNEPYREFTIVFHDEIGAVQAFPHFEDEVLSHTLHSVRDAFAINYGTGGIGAEILANRLKVGPMHDCVDCKYEEFFLASWAVGDPAMVVDKPANFPCTVAELQLGKNCTPDEGRKATKAFYPDDPSNVYHSYMNDRVKFRNLLAGSDDHHIFHLHAHQWVHSPRSRYSSYLDSQSIGQGAGFTYEIAYQGSGNRNKTVGDSIFHCHFYPHFAQGMWSLWRVHDVLEAGTILNDQGEPRHTETSSVVDGTTVTTILTDTRALPDDEILTGTPIPAIVPLPSKPLPPPPTDVQLVDGQIDEAFVFNAANTAYAGGSGTYFNPGFPFYIPGKAGHRAPHPPMDFAKDSVGNELDGGLPRHRIVDDEGNMAMSTETRLDFHKAVLKVAAEKLPEAGTPLEDLAMKTHELSGFVTPAPDGNTAPYRFELNGRLRQPGAPFADPCPDNAGQRKYQAVDIELDVIFNKAGWHFPQQRIISLLDDVPATLAGTRPPEPLFFRAEENDCITYELTNLVPFEYQVDDFQVRTPTDILGQHIHLVKFDVTASDGGGNGYNYEDGTFSPEEVQERIKAIRALYGSCAEGSRVYDPVTGRLECPEAEYDPRFNYLNGVNRNCNEFEDVLGAQTTVQRWWAEELPPGQNPDAKRTLRTVFTHDHFGPSTHQQAGLYAGLVVEPEGSAWYHNETGAPLGGRGDGGPTSWQAWIDPPNDPSYREFMIEFADFQLAYEPGNDGGEPEPWRSCPDTLTGWADPPRAINPPGRKSVGPPKLYEKPRVCPTNPDDPDGTLLTSIAPSSGGQPLPPCPEAVSADDPGIFVVNYRNEPLAHRISDKFDSNPSSPPAQASNQKGDPSFAYASLVPRANLEMEKVPDGSLTRVPYPALTSGLVGGDPFTPVLRVYEGDPVQIRVLVGAHEEEHNFVVHGSRWLFEPFWIDSGYRNSQMMGISEWFDFIVPPLPNLLREGEAVDLLYKPNASAEGQWTGTWGLIRQYQGTVPGLVALDTNPDGRAVHEQEDRGAVFLDVPESDVTPTVATVDYDQQTVVTEEPEEGEEPSAEEPLLVAGKGATAPPGNVFVGCPTASNPILHEVVAVSAREVLGNAGLPPSLFYNHRPDSVRHWDETTGAFVGDKFGPLHDPTAIMFVRKQDLRNGPGGRPRLRATAPVEPLILRARAGDCLRVKLYNDLPTQNQGARFAYDLDGWSGWHMLYEGFNANDVEPSLEVGLHPQLVWYDPTRADGTNVGINLTTHGKQTVSPGRQISYYWYAGDVVLPSGGGPISYVPIEYGVTGLTSSDPLKHTNKGAVGALVIEPAGSVWNENVATHDYLPGDGRPTRTVADVDPLGAGGSFRELVTIFQDDLNLRYTDGNEPAGSLEPPDDPVESLDVNEDPTESGQKAFNYRTEPIWFRLDYSPNTPTSETRDIEYENSLVADSVTHELSVAPGVPVRFRVVHPGGHTQNHAFEVQGHLWQELPFVTTSPLTGPYSNVLGANAGSEWQGMRHGIGPGAHFDHLLALAGGVAGVTGAYLYRDYVSWAFHNGLWGLFVVETGGGTPPDTH